MLDPQGSGDVSGGAIDRSAWRFWKRLQRPGSSSASSAAYRICSSASGRRAQFDRWQVLSRRVSNSRSQTAAGLWPPSASRPRSFLDSARVSNTPSSPIPTGPHRTGAPNEHKTVRLRWIRRASIAGEGDVKTDGTRAVVDPKPATQRRRGDIVHRRPSAAIWASVRRPAEPVDRQPLTVSTAATRGG